MGWNQVGREWVAPVPLGGPVMTAPPTCASTGPRSTESTATESVTSVKVR